MSLISLVGENIPIKYRSRYEIISSILQYAATTKEITKTRIMYHSFLSYLQLNQYLNYLIKNELLRHNTRTNQYKITDKGLKFLNLYTEIEEMVKSK
jgi:predicted transcriptional regulator